MIGLQRHLNHHPVENVVRDNLRVMVLIRNANADLQHVNRLRKNNIVDDRDHDNEKDEGGMLRKARHHKIVVGRVNAGIDEKLFQKVQREESMIGEF